jgi:hypothetical protein
MPGNLQTENIVSVPFPLVYCLSLPPPPQLSLSLSLSPLLSPLTTRRVPVHCLHTRLHELHPSLCMCMPLWLPFNGSVNTFPRKRQIVRGIILYAVRVVLKESRLLVVARVCYSVTLLNTRIARIGYDTRPYTGALEATRSGGDLNALSDTGHSSAT